MEQTVSKKFFLKTMVPLLLVAALFVSLAVPLSARADTPVFSGVTDAQAEEGQTFDLLDGVTAADASGNPMEVTVSQVTYHEAVIAAPNAVLTMGPAGASYQVEYMAFSADETGDTYTAHRNITSTAAPVTQEPSSCPEETGSVPETPQLPETDAAQPETDAAQPETEVTQPETEAAAPDENSEPAEDMQLPDTESDQPETIVPEEIIPEETPEAEPETDALSDPLQAQGGLPITFKNGLHYVVDPDYPNDPIILYCMNNQLAWPHSTVDHPHVPNYTEGYLTPDDFDSPAQYNEFIAKLRKILFAGYPYNGERLYKLVPEGELHIPTEQEFNNMLILPPQLSADFPYLAHHKYSLEDLAHPKHYNELMDFVGEVRRLYPDKTTEHGLRYNDILSMPFYKAAFSMTFNGSDVDTETVRTTFAQFYSKSYFVTHSQAYDSTSHAVWKLMYDYGIESNNISNLDHDPLAGTLYQYCQHGDLLDHAPDPNQIYVEGDLSFSYNPKDGMWHSGLLTIVEPTEYNGLYHLDLPEGVTAICENVNHVYANEAYELISAERPKDGSQFRVHASIDWLQDMRQYSPINSTEFQHMVGAVMRKTNVSLTLNYSSHPEGSVEIMKVVKGTDIDQQDEFFFVMTLSEPIDGQYGDLYFDKGVAEFTLLGGEMKVADHLPTGASYSITEAPDANYHAVYSNAEGTIPSNNSTRVTIENTKLNTLSVSKSVQGEMGDRTKPFHFDITLESADGVPYNGTYPCFISSVSGTDQPVEETLTFTDGKATVTLTHDQQAQIRGIPYDFAYTVTEQEANQDGYSTTYNQSSTAASGVLNQSAEVQVVNRKEMVPATGVCNTGMGGMIAGMCLATLGVTLPLVYGIARRKRGHRHG